MRSKRKIISIVFTAGLLLFCHAIFAQGYVTIGKQVWTTDNLSVTTFSNGDTIPEAQSPKKWKKASAEAKPAWCHVSGYGKQTILYNWYTVHDSRGLAPKGWHIPSDKEWDTLVAYLGGWKLAGRKMADKAGFAARDLGYRAYYSGMSGSGAYFWSSSVDTSGSDGAGAIYILYFKELNYIGKDDLFFQLYHSYYEKDDGLSVRCIKD